MKKICIFCFSGTGMTRYVVEKLKFGLEEQQAQADIFDLANTRIADVALESYDALGIAYPIHSFNAPKIVIDFARSLPQVNSLPAFIISTAGEYAAINFAAAKYVTRILHKKGFDVFYDRQFIMPCNFIIKFDADKVQQLLSEISSQVPTAVQEIINGAPFKQQSNFLARMMTFVGRGEWFGAKIMAKFYYTNKDCTHCSICADNCPNRNISVGKDYVRFHWHCGLCMRCLYICPRKALKVRRPFRFICLDSWYDNEEINNLCKKFTSITAPPQR